MTTVASAVIQDRVCDERLDEQIVLRGRRHHPRGWIADGRVRYRDDVVEGPEHAPKAFIGMLERRDFGKLVVTVGW